MHTNGLTKRKRIEVSIMRLRPRELIVLTNDFEYDEVKRKLENPGSSILPCEQRFYNCTNETISSLKLFKAGHKHHLGHVSCTSGTDRDIS